MNTKHNPLSAPPVRYSAARGAIVRAALAALLSCLSLAAWAQPSLKVHGSVALKGLIEPNLAEISAKCGSKLELVANGADNGLLDLVAGKADVAMISVTLEELAVKLNLKTPGAVDVSKLKSVALGYSKIVLIVNTNNAIRKVTDQQAVGLLSGKITSWKEVGGPDQTVEVVAPPANSGVRTAIESRLLKTEKFSPDAKLMVNPRQVQAVVSQSIRAIGPLAVSVLSDKVAALTLDNAIQTPMVFVVRGEVSPEVLKLAEAVKPFVQ